MVAARPSREDRLKGLLGSAAFGGADVHANKSLPDIVALAPADNGSQAPVGSSASPHVDDRPQHLVASLPCSKEPESRKRRKALFSRWDPNGNGILSLAEIDKGVEELLGKSVPKPVVNRAFHAARDMAPPVDGFGSDYIDLNEFRVLLLYLQYYLKVWDWFCRIDSNRDRHVTLDEFTASSKLLESFGCDAAAGLLQRDAGSVFRELDCNAGGVVLFDEFAHWVLGHCTDCLDAGCQESRAEALEHLRQKKPNLCSAQEGDAVHRALQTHMKTADGLPDDSMDQSTLPGLTGAVGSSLYEDEDDDEDAAGTCAPPFPSSAPRTSSRFEDDSRTTMSRLQHDPTDSATDGSQLPSLLEPRVGSTDGRVHPPPSSSSQQLRQQRPREQRPSISGSSSRPTSRDGPRSPAAHTSSGTARPPPQARAGRRECQCQHCPSCRRRRQRQELQEAVRMSLDTYDVEASTREQRDPNGGGSVPLDGRADGPAFDTLLGPGGIDEQQRLLDQVQHRRVPGSSAASSRLHMSAPLRPSSARGRVGNTPGTGVRNASSSSRVATSAGRVGRPPSAGHRPVSGGSALGASRPQALVAGNTRGSAEAIPSRVSSQVAGSRPASAGPARSASPAAPRSRPSSGGPRQASSISQPVRSRSASRSREGAAAVGGRNGGSGTSLPARPAHSPPIGHGSTEERPPRSSSTGLRNTAPQSTASKADSQQRLRQHTSCTRARAEASRSTDSTKNS